MPGFVSHTVMARDVYNTIDKNKVDIDYMISYSLGGDLCKYAKCRYDSHHKDMDKFIYTMADYIKENNLVNNKEIMGVLYGHICHYVMDCMIHPLVRMIDKVCIKNKHNHTLIEEYYDSYLVKERYEIEKKEYLKKRVLKAKANRKISKMLDYVYTKVYNTQKVSIYYNLNLLLYRLLSKIYIIFSKGFIEKIIGLNRFLDNNKSVDIFNEDNKIMYKDYLRNECSNSLMSLYEESIDVAREYIKNINNYLNI